VLTEEQPNLNNTMKKSKMKLHIPLPVIQATDTVKGYLATLPEDEKKALNSNYDIALKAGAAERICLLVQTFYHIHTIQTFLQGDIEILLDNWGLWLKGFRPALTNLQQAEDKFYRIMREMFNHGGGGDVTDEYYMRDVDSLFKKLMRWEALPMTWDVGQPQKTNLIKAGEEKGGDETLVIEDKYEWCRIGAIDVEAIPNDYRSNIPEVYAVGKMMDNETVQMGKKVYRSISAARAVASKYANSERGKVFIIYRRTNQWHYRPMEFKLNEEEEEK
jgi:hypothetical protein